MSSAMPAKAMERTISVSVTPDMLEVVLDDGRLIAAPQEKA